MRTSAIGLVLVIGGALVAINAVPFLLRAFPVLRGDAGAGVGAVAGVFAASVGAGALVWWRLRRK